MYKKKTIIEHSIVPFLKVKKIKRIYVAINKNDEYFNKLPISKNKKIRVVFGGNNRSDSVVSALNCIKENCWILIHDAVRPCISLKDIYSIINKVTKSTNCVGGILAYPMDSTIKKLKNSTVNFTIDKKNIWNAMTPQIFDKNILKKCLYGVYKKKISISDESQALEIFGYHPIVVLGNRNNIKVTYIEDIKFLDYFL
ncbi:2-C-methyl-D-erythritol 4-phosphate cytidylyltransferase [bacterium endosymbiont of Pedicinus badii]|uniref:2-C-methyl-D-erythritol 4-phosphate cytidylyltransferase n=1 Tax=bacterium endosymbiont of Pedicinus badii TaxID=1719126 RepID=UPI0009BC09E0|nr:2-C-methyl-D-erythritol 4-phosphate cytidylyltransferase [bacterium endosymbiont of Pedicinus badii]